MAKNTKIEWADHTWNPWYGCTKVSAGCKNCYAKREMTRFGKNFNTITRSKTTLNDPLKWLIPSKVFVCSWGDFFHEDVPNFWREDAWVIMARADHHTYLLLTKRPENIPDMLPWWWSSCSDSDYKPPHIWLGITAENQETADERIPQLLKIPAIKHFVSVEPMLGQVDLREWFPPLDWIIVGGESGPNCRPMSSEWVVDIRDQCIQVGVPFFFKQWGSKRKDPDGTWGGKLLEGREWSEFPNE